MPLYRIVDLYDVTRTIAHPVLDAVVWPWEALGAIEAFVRAVGPTLPKDLFTQLGEDVWVAKSAKVAESAFIGGPCIIDEGAEVRHCAFIRGSAVVGKGAVVGNSTELKNALLFDGVQAPHFNYVGDSVLGYKAHLGAGVITSNVKSDNTNVVVHGGPDGEAETGRRKVGALLGDRVEVGCNSVLAPGCMAGKNATIYPLSHVRGVVPENHIFKAPGVIVARQ